MVVQEAQFLGSIHYLSPPEQEEVKRALARAKNFHDGQLRDSGLPYITHPIAVANYLATLEADKDTLVAALLHDVVEDTHISPEELERDFGPVVSKLVEGVTKLSELRYEGRRQERQVASLRKMLLTASNDLRVIFIKLADRWHNVETIMGLQEDKRQRVADETLDIYVPFARLLGFWELKSRMEEVCFPIAFPKQSEEWKKALDETRSKIREERERFLRDVNAQTSSDVEASLQKTTDYEAFRKLHGNLERLQDVRNLDSVLLKIKSKTASALDCYRVLGELHMLYPVWVGSFRDYITAPQPNGYQALHTVIFLSRSHQILLRIQTQEMYEHGAKRKLSQWPIQKDNDIYKALTSLHIASSNKEGFLKDLREAVLKERINVFTPSGEIIALPQGASGIDFAFAVNPDHIFYLINIRVNGELREVTYQLKDGDTVELVLLQTGKAEARSMWVEKVKSIDAREQLKKSLQEIPRDRRIEEGRALLAFECHKRRLPQWILTHLPRMQLQLSRAAGAETFEELLEKIGSGHVPVGSVVDLYRSILMTPHSWVVQFMNFMHLLPRSRLLDKEARVMEIDVFAVDRQGLIHDITRCFAERKINIAKFGVFAVPPHDALYKIRLEVRNFDEFSDLLDVLLQVPSVKTVLRKR